MLRAEPFATDMTVFAALLAHPLATFKTHLYATISAEIGSADMTFNQTVVADRMGRNLTHPNPLHFLSARFATRIEHLS